MKRILYTSAQIRQAIIQLFSSSDKRRVVITAFVGDGAEAYLPRPNGLRLICWPKAGGTNPNALRKLKQVGVKIDFVDSLHMKVYWTEDQGAVITSANLSTNALGAGNLKEIGVLLAPGEFDIDRVISSIKPRPWSAAEIRKLDRQHNLYVTRNKYRGRKSQTPSFVEWSKSPARPEWKLGDWYEPVELSSCSREILKKEYGCSDAQEFYRVGARQYRKGEWILSFKLDGQFPSQVAWMFADLVVRVPRSDKTYDNDCPYEVLQVHPLKSYPPPPFRTDKRFLDAFSKAIHEYGAARVKELESSKPSYHLIKLIYQHYT